MIAGWYKEEITSIKKNEYIQYRVVKSIPNVNQDFTEIRFKEIEDNRVEVIWTIDIEVPVPLVGSLFNQLAGKMSSVLYGTIINAGKKEIERGL